MATNTTNYDLIKPEYADAADIADINSNMDVIDGAMNDNATAISSANTIITAHSQSIATNTEAIATNATAISSNSTAIANINSKATVNAIRVDNGDYNNLKTPGVYACNNCSHSPEGKTGWFTLEVLPMGGQNDGNPDYPTQRATQLATENVYIRTCVGGTWDSWQELAKKSRTPQYTAVDVSGTPIVTSDSGWYYNQINYASILPTNARIIGVASSGSWDANVFYTIQWPTSIKFTSPTSKTLASNHSIVIFYYVDD